MKIDIRLLVVLTAFAGLFIVGQLDQRSKMESLKAQVRDCQTK